jgi:Protein of unknown function (DUF3147)
MFLAGGVAVAAFAALGDTLRPKSFAGLFGAAPSIALATLVITLRQQGPAFVALEAQSMIVGALALAAYSWTVCLSAEKIHADVLGCDGGSLHRVVCACVWCLQHPVWTPMIVQLNPSALRQTHWYEFLIRFALGGATALIAGLIASRFGPVVGGLFLAFPAIFPARATLIEKQVREGKEKAGLSGVRRGNPGSWTFRNTTSGTKWRCPCSAIARRRSRRRAGDCGSCRRLRGRNRRDRKHRKVREHPGNNKNSSRRTSCGSFAR